MKKKIVSLLLTAVMAVSLAVPSVVWAGEEEAAASEETAAETGAEVSEKLPQGDWYIGLANGYMGNTWRAQYVEAFEAKAEQYKQAGVIKDYISASTSGDVTEQLNQINDMISKGIDCLLINPISPSSMAPIIAKCKAADVLLVVASDPAGVDDSLVEVLTDNRAFFAIMTQWLVDKLDGKGNIVHITGTPGMPADLVRQKVAEEILAEYPDIKVLGTAPGSWSQTEAQTAMSTFLSTYDNIDAVLAQDVMSEGIIRAYETAGVDVPLMTGDYVMSFFRKWETMDNLDACATTFQAQASADALAYAVRKLNGMELNVELEANPFDETMMNAINIPPSYCVTRDGITEADAEKAWVKGYDKVQYISLQEALELGEDLADTAALGTTLSEEQWDAMFK
ncbi:substrate-binding domain-containing protein [Blautia schinkii]|nr:substrate-binding domain-containing protein [Blautia schinkii]